MISLSIFKRPYVSGNPVVWFTLITSSNAYVKDDKITGDSGVVLFGALTVCFSTKEISATVEIFFNDTGSPALIKDPGDFDSIFVVMPMKG